VLFPHQSRVAWEEVDGKGGLLASAGLKCDAYLRPAGQPQKPKAGTKRKEYDGKHADEDDCVVVDGECAGAGGAAGAGAGGTVRVELWRKRHTGPMCPSQRGCLYLTACRSFLSTLNLNAAYMDPEHDRCYCPDCATRIPEVLEVSRPHGHAYECAETDPEQSSRALRPVCWHGETWRRKQTTVYYDCKQFVPHFFLCSCTCLILGLGPQTKPPSMTTHHGLVTSHFGRLSGIIGR
jgi:hypothetical protein